MFKKLLHRITVVWCLYGLVRLCIFVNPLIFRVAGMIKPVFEDNSEFEIFEDVAWNPASTEQIMVVWSLILIAAIILLIFSVAIHHFSNWFFNTQREEE